MTKTELPDNMQHKSVAVTGVKILDDTEGIVEAFVAGIGNKDSVGDIIQPGAFNASLGRRKPKGIWSHDWNRPVSKTLEVYEVPAGDPRLPEQMKLAGIGGLYVKAQFNLNSFDGREAYSWVKFFDDEGEWCVDEETEILTQRGWLKYDEIVDGDLAYTLDEQYGVGHFEPIEAVNVFDDKIRTLRHIKTGGFSSLSTASHRWPLASNEDGGKLKWTTTGEMKSADRIVRCAPRIDTPDEPKYSDSFVELVGWFWTEGWWNNDVAFIGQSTSANPQHVASIRKSLIKTFPGEWSEKHSKDDIATFRIKKETSKALSEVTGADKEPTFEFIYNLTSSQLALLIDTCLKGDGTESASGQRTWYQVSKKGTDAYEMVCALAGIATVTSQPKDYGNRFGRAPQRVSLLKSGVAKPLDAIRVKGYGYKSGEPRTDAIDELVEHEGIVWCPTTGSSTWLAKRDGAVYFTGNSIGYVPADQEYDKNQKANLLKQIELFEYSPVLFGANSLTSTVGVKVFNTEEDDVTIKIQGIKDDSLREKAEAAVAEILSQSPVDETTSDPEVKDDSTDSESKEIDAADEGAIDTKDSQETVEITEPDEVVDETIVDDVEVKSDDNLEVDETDESVEVKVDEITDELEVKEGEVHADPEVKAVPGSYEQRTHELCEALRSEFGGPGKYVWPVATFDSTVVFCVEGYDEEEGEYEDAHYEVGYAFDGEEITFSGEPVEVELVEVVMAKHAVLDAAFKGHAALLKSILKPLVEASDDDNVEADVEIKSAVDLATAEKAGRALSTKNRDLLESAKSAIESVLGAEAVEDETEEKIVEAVEDTVETKGEDDTELDTKSDEDDTETSDVATFDASELDEFNALMASLEA